MGQGVLRAGRVDLALECLGGISRGDALMFAGAVFGLGETLDRLDGDLLLES